VEETIDDRILKEVSSDLIKRVGVYKIEGREKMIDHLNTKLESVNEERRKYFAKLALDFVFDEKIDNVEEG
jgi:hypothetical protein